MLSGLDDPDEQHREDFEAVLGCVLDFAHHGDHFALWREFDDGSGAVWAVWSPDPRHHHDPQRWVSGPYCGSLNPRSEPDDAELCELAAGHPGSHDWEQWAAALMPSPAAFPLASRDEAVGGRRNLDQVVLSLLAQDQDRWWTVEDMALGVPEAGVELVSEAMHALAQRGLLAGPTNRGFRAHETTWTGLDEAMAMLPPL